MRYMKKNLRGLKPPGLPIFSDTPTEVVEIHVRKKLDPIYNSSGKILPIRIEAVRLKDDNGILTGDISFVPNEMYRLNLMHLEQQH